MFQDLLMQFAGLAGFAAFVALLVNVLKSVKLVSDGNAETWSAGLNLIGLVGLYLLRIIKPDIVPGDTDTQIAVFVTAMTPMVNWILMLLSSKVAHKAVRGFPFLGRSYSKEVAKVYKGA